MKKNGPDELQKLINEYFESLEPESIYDANGELLTDKSGIPVLTERKPATIASMAYAVGLTSKEELLELRDKKAYTRVVDRALLRVEAYTERMLFDKTAAAGAKYLLQSSFGRCDVSEQEDSGGGVVVLADIDGTEASI